jgi:hypothetical protein
MFDRTLRRNDRGEDVRELQQFLVDAGFNPGSVDGVFGPETEKAVRDFQLDDLGERGVVGPETIAALTETLLVPDSRDTSVTGQSVHIGLNRLDLEAYFPLRPKVLRGCINDANAMRDLAADQGFATSEPLLNEAATSDAVIAAISGAADTLEPGDFFLLTYAGHGSQVRDVSGDEERYDQTWCLWDRQFLDDELYALWGRFQPDVRICVISDSCHSGSVTRDFLVALDREAVSAGVERDGEASSEVTSDAIVDLTLGLADIVTPILNAAGRETLDTQTRREVTKTVIRPVVDSLLGLSTSNGEVEDPLDRLLPEDEAERDFNKRQNLYRRVKRAAQRETPPTCSVLLLSGCQDNQTSLDGRRNGLFTEKLLNVWSRRNVPNYTDFYQQILREMPAGQTPNLFWATRRNAAFEAQQPFTITI